MASGVPDFGMIRVPPSLVAWWRSLPANDQVNEWKNRVIKAHEKIEHLEFSLLELEAKVRMRVTGCQNAGEGDEEDMARVFLAETLKELNDLINESMPPEEGPSGTK